MDQERDRLRSGAECDALDLLAMLLEMLAGDSYGAVLQLLDRVLLVLMLPR